MRNSPNRHAPRRRSAAPPLISPLALYLAGLNILCISLLIAMLWPTAQPSSVAGLPTAVVQAMPVQPVIFTQDMPQPTLAPPPPPVAAGPLQAGPMPILMYHYIRSVDANADPMGYGLSVTPELFDQQMAWLRESGYNTVSMATARRCIAGEAACPPNPIVLTFDDGYEDAYTAALPVMQRYGMTGTFYIVNRFVGQPGYMNWEQLAAMRDAGMEIGAHSLDHLDMTTLDLAEMRRQAEQSKLELELRLGTRVTSFCYPAGRYNGDVEGQVRDAGFEDATTTRWDDDYSDMFGLPRRRIEGGRGLDTFAAVVQGG